MVSEPPFAYTDQRYSLQGDDKTKKKMNAELMHFNAPDRIAGRDFLPFSFKRPFYLWLSKQSVRVLLKDFEPLTEILQEAPALCPVLPRQAEDLCLGWPAAFLKKVSREVRLVITT